ncbi:unnamed protein product [Dibothriocephalus latus]|uniref:Uncharacterized protein n=1 Tax=Dibothriocephalus latus TaxID=60516 RepID=A0A3P7LKA2_DIBLA|nr:unnamed protein product [Dibothriocephalus latus]
MATALCFATLDSSIEQYLIPHERYKVDTRTFPGNRDYWYSKWAYAEVAAVEVDGKNIPKAPAGQHCFPPNDCWEVIDKKHISYVTGPLKGDQATITLELTKGKPITLLYKKAYSGCPCNSVKASVKADYVQDVADCESMLHAIIYDQPLKVSVHLCYRFE